LPTDISAEAACLLACGVITGVGAAVHAAGIRAGQDVVVIGAGGVGLNSIQGARIAGARRIVAVDLTEEKLAIAAEFGATDGVLATGPTPWDDAAAALGGRLADAVLITVGTLPAYNDAPKYVGRGGRIVAIGMPHSGGMAQYEPASLAAVGQTVIGSKMGDVVIQRDIPWMIDLYRQGRLKLDELVSGRWRLDQINAIPVEQRTAGDYDDLGASYDKLGQHDQAIQTMLDKIDRFPNGGLYETHANLGTFYIHNGDLE